MDKINSAKRRYIGADIRRVPRQQAGMTRVTVDTNVLIGDPNGPSVHGPNQSCRIAHSSGGMGRGTPTVTGAEAGLTPFWPTAKTV
jgi:hypothetical protein